LAFCGFLVAVHGLKLATGFELRFRPADPAVLQFFSSTVAHSDLEHLLNNLFFLGLFGAVYENLTSTRTFFATFAAAALAANLSAFVFYPGSTIIGASGGAFGVLAAVSVYRPNSPGLALGVPVPMWAGLVIYTLTQLAGLTGSGPTAYEAHLVGMAVGAPVGLWLRDADSRESSGEDPELDDESFRERIRRWERKWMMDG
jgi:membrane associated rhomboid family serine protease